MNETKAVPVTPLSQDRVAALTEDNCERIRCDEPRELQSVPYQLHKYQTWATLGYQALKEEERRVKLQDTALANCIVLLQKEMKELATRVRFLEENYRRLLEKCEKSTEDPCKVNENSVLCDN